MKFVEVLRFELAYQARRVSTWIPLAVLLALTYYASREIYVDNARRDGYLFNAPFVIAAMTMLGSMMGLLSATQLAGEAAARDVQTRMDPLVYTTPVGKGPYLGGRFLAAFVLHAVILLALPLGLAVAAIVPGPEPELIGAFRISSYLAAYLSIAVPNAFIATALLFSIALLGRRTMAGYAGILLLLGAVVFSRAFLAGTLGWWELAKLLDPFGMTALAEISRIWTPGEKSARLIGPQSSLIANRVLWLCIAAGVLALTHARFRFAHRSARKWRWRRTQVAQDLEAVARVAPQVHREFGFATHLRQMLAVTQECFRTAVVGWGGLVLLAIVTLGAVGATQIEHLGVPLVVTSARIATSLAAPLTSPQEFFGMMIPLFIAIYAGELVWREREVRLNEITGAVPAPDWVWFLGKFAGLGLALVALQALMVVAGLLVQVADGNSNLEIGLYASVLFGLQLPDYLLFAHLALVLQTVVNHKFIGHLAVVIAYALMSFGPALGVTHQLLIYGSDPGWSYSDMRGFGGSIGPWLWFELYWAAWAVLLGVAATLRPRWTRRVGWVCAGCVALIVASGSFIFHNSNRARTPSDELARRAEYERRYGQYRSIPQPEITRTSLQVEIYPERSEADIRGTYQLVNSSAEAIGTVHVATKAAVNTSAIRFDRPAKSLLSDEEFRHHVYALETALKPGETLQVHFEVQFKPRGFGGRGRDVSVAANGTYFTNDAWLPAIGYGKDRELRGAGDRRKYRLTARPETPSLDNVEARRSAARTAFEAVVGTSEGQIAVAPGKLLRRWAEGGRRYFRYATDVPIRNHYAFFSASYGLHERRWKDTAVEILHHPSHSWNIDRMGRSVEASLEYYTREFGPYRHRQLRMIEQPGDGVSLHAAPVNISYEEGFSLLNPDEDARGFDFPFAVVAHEVAHQWWGATLTPARVEGAAVLTESLAWYSAFQVVEQALGREHLGRLLDMMRGAYALPRNRADVPLLRATDSFLTYRKGPFAMYAVREYVGADQVNTALRRLLEKHVGETTPLATSLDLYRELQAVTPQSLQYLLAGLFETNTFWELATQRVTSRQTTKGKWQVTLDVKARKVVVDTSGVETEVSMNDLIEVGVFSSGTGEPLYLQKHRVRSGEQRITVEVSSKPEQAGIDPRNLLIDVSTKDNIKAAARAD